MDVNILIVYIIIIIQTQTSWKRIQSKGQKVKMVESFSSSEVIPYIIGSILTLALIKWLFSTFLMSLYFLLYNLYNYLINLIGRVEDRRITSPSLYFSYSPDPEAV